jgi:hypothetical protein
VYRVPFSRPAAILLLAGLTLPGPLPGQFRVEAVRPVATGGGARNAPIVTGSAAGYVVSWSESLPAATLSGQPAVTWLMRQRVGFDGRNLGPADTVARAGGSPTRPALAVGPDASWLAWDFTEPGMRPGDRDLALVRYAGFFGTPQPARRLTRDAARAPVVTEAAPSLLFDTGTGELILANTWGVLRPSRGQTPAGYDSISVEIRVMTPEGAPLHRFTVKGPDEAGEAADPFITRLPPGWRERYILAYTSNGGRRQHGAAGHSVYLELFGADWRVLGGRHMAWPVGGAASPALAAVGGRLYLAWEEPARGEILLSELDDELWPRRPMRLREALADSELGQLFAFETPGLGAPMLFDDFGRLGIAFVITREWNPASGRARQEIWISRLTTPDR